MGSYTLTPAYGRDYKSAAEARADFEAGKDFCDSSYGATGAYINGPQIPDGAPVTLRFARLAKSCAFRKGDPIPAPRKRGPRKSRPAGYRVRVLHWENAELSADGIDGGPESGASLLLGTLWGSKARAMEKARAFAKRRPRGERATFAGAAVFPVAKSGEVGRDAIYTTGARPPVSVAAEVTDGSGYAANGLRFATEADAEAYARELLSRWLAARDWRPRWTSDPVTHTVDDAGRAVDVRNERG